MLGSLKSFSQVKKKGLVRDQHKLCLEIQGNHEETFDTQRLIRGYFFYQFMISCDRVDVEKCPAYKGVLVRFSQKPRNLPLVKNAPLSRQICYFPFLLT